MGESRKVYPTMNFSEFIYKKRVSLGYTLRNFCQIKGYDPAYISRLENGRIPAPESDEKLKALATALEIEQSTRDWVYFFDLAAVSRGKIPGDLNRDIPNAIKFLPAFYRAIRQNKITDKDIDKLLGLLKGRNDGDKAGGSKKSDQVFDKSGVNSKSKRVFD